MKRDMDLIPNILIEVEKKDTPTGWVELKIEGYSSYQISYHIKLLSEAGLLEAMNLTTNDGFDWQPIALTWEGHEFLDAAKDSTLWNKAKKKIGKELTSISFEILKSLLIGYGKQELGIP